MCLRWIARQAAGSAAPWSRVLDYGCGSGVLAIAAGLFGAGAIDAVDIDPAAVEATVANASANGVALRAGTADSIGSERFDLILANILATPLKLLAPLLSTRLAPAGTLVLSGILEHPGDGAAGRLRAVAGARGRGRGRRLDPDDRRAAVPGPRGMISR